MLKADLHIHTKYSMDCDTPLEKIIERCLETGINCIAIADHDTIEGAVEMQEIAPFPVIVAGEILTPQGEIMGMFLKERVPIGLPIEEAIACVKSQGGLVCLPHPFDTFRGLRIDGARLDELAEQIDVVEVFNARTHFSAPISKADAFAEKHGIVKSAGSDAHSPGEIGHAHVEMREFDGKDDFLQALKGGKIQGHRSSPLVHFGTVWTKIKNNFRSANNV